MVDPRGEHDFPPESDNPSMQKLYNTTFNEKNRHKALSRQQNQTFRSIKRHSDISMPFQNNETLRSSFSAKRKTKAAGFNYTDFYVKKTVSITPKNYVPPFSPSFAGRTRDISPRETLPLADRCTQQMTRKRSPTWNQNNAFLVAQTQNIKIDQMIGTSAIREESLEDTGKLMLEASKEMSIEFKEEELKKTRTTENSPPAKMFPSNAIMEQRDSTQMTTKKMSHKENFEPFEGTLEPPKPQSKNPSQSKVI